MLVDNDLINVIIIIMKMVVMINKYNKSNNLITNRINRTSK